MGKEKPEFDSQDAEKQGRTEKKLSPVKLKTLKRGRHADGGGLYLDVQESGSRSWILRTTIRGKRKEIGLGGLSSRTLAQAREAAANLLAKAKKGEDILEQKRLGKWVNSQRTANSRGKLNPARKQQLDSIGFVWNLRPNLASAR